jgi:hypothetical protein
MRLLFGALVLYAVDAVRELTDGKQAIMLTKKEEVWILKVCVDRYAFYATRIPFTRFRFLACFPTEAAPQHFISSHECATDLTKKGLQLHTAPAGEMPLSFAQPDTVLGSPRSTATIHYLYLIIHVCVFYTVISGRGMGKMRAMAQWCYSFATSTLVFVLWWFKSITLSTLPCWRAVSSYIAALEPSFNCFRDRKKKAWQEGASGTCYSNDSNTRNPHQHQHQHHYQHHSFQCA